MSYKPTISPATASETWTRSLDINSVALFNLTGFPVLAKVTSIPFLNSPLPILTKAIRSRWLGFILAWILKTNPENSGSSAANFSSPLTICSWGAGAKLTKLSKKVSTPKLVKAEPKKTGVWSPFKIFSLSKVFPASFNKSISSKVDWYKLSCAKGSSSANFPFLSSGK